MIDPADPPGPGKRLATTVAAVAIGGMLALILTHCTLGWPG